MDVALACVARLSSGGLRFPVKDPVADCVVVVSGRGGVVLLGFVESDEEDVGLGYLVQ